jgi:hypothetical protein
MSGFEYAAAATMIQSGNVTEGLTVLKAISDRYTGTLKVGYKGAWGNFGYSGNPFGDDECGKFYSRAMSIWSVLLAFQGFSYDGPAKSIGFNPVWNPENHISFFTASEGWGNFAQKRSLNSQINTIELVYGQLKIDKIEFTVREELKVNSVIVNIGNKRLDVNYKQNLNVISIELDNMLLKAGQKIEFNIQ